MSNLSYWEQELEKAEARVEVCKRAVEHWKNRYPTGGKSMDQMKSEDAAKSIMARG